MPVFGGKAVGAFAPGTISFEWRPDPEVIAQELMVTAGRLEDRSQPLLLSERVAIADMRERFDTETDPDGNSWVPWAQSYEARARSTNSGILVKSTALRDSATDPSAYNITADSLFFSTAGMPEYWIYHQTGAERKGRLADEFDEGEKQFRERAAALGLTVEGREGAIGANILPARPFVGPSFEAQLQMIEIFDQWFDGVVNETFRRGSRVVAVKRGAGGRFTKQQSVF